MSKSKLKKYPKVPKDSASIEVKQNWIAKAKEIDKYNAPILAARKKSKSLSESIRKIKASRKKY
jgi:hypothetical protein